MMKTSKSIALIVSGSISLLYVICAPYIFSHMGDSYLLAILFFPLVFVFIVGYAEGEFAAYIALIITFFVLWLLLYWLIHYIIKKVNQSKQKKNTS